MRFRFRGRASAKEAAADAENAAGGAGGGGDGGGAVVADASPYHGGGVTADGSKDESFFEARPWLDSDSEDDFYSVRGDFTPSRGTTPDRERQTPFTTRISVDRLEPSLTEKKQRLLELLQDKQQYDDDNIADAGIEMENGVVHAEEYLNFSGKDKKAKKSSTAGCFPSSFCKINFRSCRKKRKELKAKLN